MIDINIFSGKTYVTTGNVKQTEDGETFIKCGNLWLSDKGDTVQERDDDQFNLNTGISSKFGDPFDA